MTETNPIPAQEQEQGAAAPHLIISPTYRDPVNGALYVHEALKQVRDPWDDAERQETHIPPVKAAESFGDVASFAAYVLRYGLPTTTLLTWNSAGLKAVLDYHNSHSAPGRCQWTAAHLFQQAAQLGRWVGFADGRARDQKGVIEFLEDMADTVVSPSAADVTGILSTLRASVGSNAVSTLNSDGSYSIQYSKDAKLTGRGTIPPTFTIRVPVLVGHTSEDGSPWVYNLTVRLRVTPTEQGVVFRLSIPNLSTVLEDAYADRVAAAKSALGDAYPILRAAN